MYDLALTDDSSLADMLAPVETKQTSNAVTFAETAWATIMDGLPITPRAEFNHIEIVETWLKYMVVTVQRIMQSGGMGTPQQVMGLQNAAAHIEREIQSIAQDENEKQRVKEYSDVLGKVMNEVKGMMQRLQEAAQQSQGGNGQLPPEAQAKIVSSGILAQSSAKIKEAAAAQKMKHKEQSFALDQRRREQEHQLEMQRSVQDAQVDTHVTDMKTSAEIAAADRKAKEEPKPSKNE